MKNKHKPETSVTEHSPNKKQCALSTWLCESCFMQGFSPAFLIKTLSKPCSTRGFGLPLNREHCSTRGKLFKTVFLWLIPNIFISHHKCFAKWLWSVEPHARILLHGCRQLPSDGHGAGVQGTGNGRQEGLISATRSNPCKAEKWQSALHDMQQIKQKALLKR